MHEIAHTQMKVGLASAMAVVLLLIIFTVTIFQNLFFNKVMPSDEVEVKKNSIGGGMYK